MRKELVILSVVLVTTSCGGGGTGSGTASTAALAPLCQPRPDPSSAGCFADETFTICASDDCRDPCDGPNVPVQCSGTGALGAVPQPDPAAGCTVIAIPTPSNTLFYCCPCGAP